VVPHSLLLQIETELVCYLSASCSSSSCRIILQAIDVVLEPSACRMAPVVVDLDIQDILNIPKERHQLALGLEVNICQCTPW